MKTNSMTPQRNTRPQRRTFGLALAAGMVMASSCTVPFLDDGEGSATEDISAEVGVSGVDLGDTTKITDGRGDLDADVGEAQPVDSTATSPDETTSSGGDEDPAPVLAVDSRFNGRSVEYLGIGVELGDLIVTNQTVDEYVAAEDPTDDDRILILEIAVTNTGNGTVTVPEGVFGIELSSGERIAPLDMTATDGDFRSTLRPAAQATERALLIFPDVNIAGGSFVISEGTAIPLYIPLDPAVPVPEPYVMELAGQPAVSGLQAPSLWDGCAYQWTGEVIGARIVLDGVENNRLVRANKGERWLAVQIRATNNTPSGNEFYPCNTIGVAHGDLSPRLRIDGFAMSSTNYQQIGARIEEDASATMEFFFPISVDTTEMEVADVDGNVVASFVVDLPAVPGEN